MKYYPPIEKPDKPDPWLYLAEHQRALKDGERVMIAWVQREIIGQYRDADASTSVEPKC